LLLIRKNILLICVITISTQLHAQNDTIDDKTLNEVLITSKRKKEILFSSLDHYLLDFDISQTAKFLLLSKHKKYSLMSLNVRFESEQLIELNFRPKKLFRDCLGYVHILAVDSIYQIGFGADGGTLQIIESKPINLYVSILQHCVASNSSGSIFRQHKKGGVEYYIIPSSGGDAIEIHSVIDSMEYWGLADLKERDIKVKYFESLRSRPKYNPLFVIADTIYLFNHLDSILLKIDNIGNPFFKQKIDYFLNKNWASEIYVDKKTNRVYSLEIKNGLLTFARLSTDFKRIEKRVKITKHCYMNKIIIFDGFAYYLEKERENDSYNKLFRQKI
jgi:hypothetical protein